MCDAISTGIMHGSVRSLGPSPSSTISQGIDETIRAQNGIHIGTPKIKMEEKQQAKTA